MRYILIATLRLHAVGFELERFSQAESCGNPTSIDMGYSFDAGGRAGSRSLSRLPGGFPIRLICSRELERYT